MRTWQKTVNLWDNRDKSLFINEKNFIYWQPEINFEAFMQLMSTSVPGELRTLDTELSAAFPRHCCLRSFNDSTMKTQEVARRVLQLRSMRLCPTKS